jgi:ubiquinone/menaquinone biosynthesis C-methylase UbiE
LSDLLEYVQDDNVIITECHRILKPAGLLIVDVRHAKKLSIITTPGPRP